MRLFFLGILIFHGAFCGLALESSFSEVCNAVQKKDCLDYEQRGLAYVICRWWHFFPSLRELDLITQKNPIYIFSLPYCDAWLKSEPSKLIPDVEGNYCKDKGDVEDPKKLLINNPKRAYLCAKHEQAQNYLRAQALRKITEVITDTSQVTTELISQAHNYFENYKSIIEQEYSDIFALDYNFPDLEEKNYSWLKLSFW